MTLEVWLYDATSYAPIQSNAIQMVLIEQNVQYTLAREGNGPIFERDPQTGQVNTDAKGNAIIAAYGALVRYNLGRFPMYLVVHDFSGTYAVSCVNYLFGNTIARLHVVCFKLPGNVQLLGNPPQTFGQISPMVAQQSWNDEEKMAVLNVASFLRDHRGTQNQEILTAMDGGYNFFSTLGVSSRVFDIP